MGAKKGPEMDPQISLFLHYFLVAIITMIWLLFRTFLEPLGVQNGIQKGVKKGMQLLCNFSERVALAKVSEWSPKSHVAY